MTTTVRTGSLIGWAQEVDGSGTIHVEDVYATGIDDLWAAVTDPERLARWLGRFEGDLRLGGTFSASFVSTWEGTGRVDVCDPPHRLLLTMEPGAPDEGQIEAWLTAEGDGTRLVVEERGFGPGEAPDHAAGWQAHIEDLRAHLEGRERVPWHDRWVALRPAYELDPS